MQSSVNDAKALKALETIAEQAKRFNDLLERLVVLAEKSEEK